MCSASRDPLAGTGEPAPSDSPSGLVERIHRDAGAGVWVQDARKVCLFPPVETPPEDREVEFGCELAGVRRDGDPKGGEVL